MLDKYNKLVRDKIPEMIRQQGDSPRVKILDDEDYFRALNKKLTEEVAEYLENYDIDELVDIAEVIYALVKYKGLSRNDFEHIRLKKYDERGGFDDKMSLVEIERTHT